MSINKLTEKDYLNYDSQDVRIFREEIQKINKIPSKIYKYFNTLVNMSSSILITNFIFTLMSLKFLIPSLSLLFLSIVILSFLIKERHVKLIFNKFFPNSKFSKNLNMIFYHFFNLNNEKLKIFFAKFVQEYKDNRYEPLITTEKLHDLIENINNKTISMQDIDFFLEVDKAIMIKVEYYKECSDKINKSKTISNLASRDLESFDKDSKIDLEKEFNFTK